MEDDFPSDSFNIKEVGGGEVDYSFTINGVISILGIDCFI